MLKEYDGTVVRHLSIWKARTRDMKKNAFNRKNSIITFNDHQCTGITVDFCKCKVTHISASANNGLFKSWKAYLSYANSAPQLFYEPMNGETVRLTQKICTGAWTDGKIFYYASGNKRVPTKVSLYKYTIKTGKTEKLCTINKNCDLVGYSKNNFYLHTMGDICSKWLLNHDFVMVSEAIT